MKLQTIIAAAILPISTLANGADLPTKATQIEYAKVCSTYGAGFFYIPGTDTCIKIGGYARFDTYVNAIASFTPMLTVPSSPAFNGPGAGGFGYPFRDDDDLAYSTRARAVIDMDARTQTDYGILRSYIRTGMQWNSQGGAGIGPASTLYFERAFIQFAGFTFGYLQSFFDSGLNYMFTTPIVGSNQWTTAAAYTALLGNGVSATLSLEDAANRTVGVQMSGATAQPVFNISTTTTGLSYTNFQGGQELPDIVANLRIDQPWGSAQLSGALHQVQVNTPGYAGAIVGLASSSNWGWAIGGVLELKLPALAAGDSLFLSADYANGAASYLGLSAALQGNSQAIGAINLSQVGATLRGTGAFYTIADAVAVDMLGNYDLTSGWSLQGQMRHYWAPGLRSALLAGYSSYDVPENVVAAFDFNVWQVGLNTIWSPVKNLDIGAEVLYSKVNGSVPLGNYAAVGNTGTIINSIAGGSTDLWSGGVRVQRNF
ncbi:MULTISPECIES: porin [Xanthobacter]|uniref:porin n=1 Tax=Xanthobacter TaxID=279 RepID=UPI00202308F6|nr:porin [Xanthobacter aminoxidans]MCL8382920.1 porin [Xanthobacter aminoxidans]